MVQGATLTKWEYLTTMIFGWDSETVAELNAIGRKGWELTGIDNHSEGATVLVFKRPKQEVEKAR